MPIHSTYHVVLALYCWEAMAVSTLFAVYDTRPYLTMDVSTGYGVWAPTYNHTVDAQLDIPLLATLHTVPWPQLRTVVDLACGTGCIGAW